MHVAPPLPVERNTPIGTCQAPLYLRNIRKTSVLKGRKMPRWARQRGTNTFFHIYYECLCDIVLTQFLGNSKMYFSFGNWQKERVLRIFFSSAQCRSHSHLDIGFRVWLKTDAAEFYGYYELLHHILVPHTYDDRGTAFATFR